jgi:hypothetical protein
MSFRLSVAWLSRAVPIFPVFLAVPAAACWSRGFVPHAVEVAAIRAVAEFARIRACCAIPRTLASSATSQCPPRAVNSFLPLALYLGPNRNPVNTNIVTCGCPAGVQFFHTTVRRRRLHVPAERTGGTPRRCPIVLTRAASATQDPHGWQGRSTDEEPRIFASCPTSDGSSVLRPCHPCESILHRAGALSRPRDGQQQRQRTLVAGRLVAEVLSGLENEPFVFAAISHSR